jgi:hypothetical protein
MMNEMNNDESIPLYQNSQTTDVPPSYQTNDPPPSYHAINAPPSYQTNDPPPSYQTNDAPPYQTNDAPPLYQTGPGNVPGILAPLPAFVPDCTICLTTLNIGDIRQTTCGHLFHKHCLEQWMLRNTTCPICRHVLVDDVSLIMNDLPEYPFVNDQYIDYLPYRVVCGRMRCCYYQIPPSFVLNLQLIGILFMSVILIDSIISWDGSMFDYFTVIITSLIISILFVLHLLLRNNWRIHNCRIVSIDEEQFS